VLTFTEGIAVRIRPPVLIPSVSECGLSRVALRSTHSRPFLKSAINSFETLKGVVQLKADFTSLLCGRNELFGVLRCTADVPWLLIGLSFVKVFGIAELNLLFI
jgi:hypothetical protein